MGTTIQVVRCTPIAIFILISTLLLIRTFKPTVYDYTVTKVSWKTTIDIEELRTVRESGWSIPAGGRLVYTKSEVHHNDIVQDGYDTVIISRQVNNKTEYYDDEVPRYKSVPVYQTKYYYDIDKWIYCRNVTESGDDKNPYYGDPLLKVKEREKSRNTSYLMTGIRRGKNLFDEYEEEVDTYSLSYDDWNTLKVGDELSITVISVYLKSWEYQSKNIMYDYLCA